MLFIVIHTKQRITKTLWQMLSFVVLTPGGLRRYHWALGEL
jgi:hypothetical protein